jgi:hypothetical protein
MNNKFRIISKLFSALLAVALVGCTSDDGPSIDDYFLNYEIPTITTASDIPVGAFYYQTNWSSNDVTLERYDRLVGERNLAATPWAQICPNVRPVLGRYDNSAGSISKTETVNLIQQHLNWANEGGIDFLILPSIASVPSTPPYMHGAHMGFVEFMSGKNPLSENKLNWGRLKYVLSVDLNNFTSGVNNTNMIEDSEVDGEGVSQRIETVLNYFRSVANRFFVDNKLYYKVNGKPMMFLYNADRVYSKDSRAFYQKIRDAVREECGMDIYLVARQNGWTPSARFHYTFMSGHVDAVYMNNMYRQNDMTRSYMYPQYINENFKYNRTYCWDNYQVDFIPAIAPSFNMWLEGDGTQYYDYPFVDKDPVKFRTMCNVAKMNLGQQPMVLIDSFNNWSSDMALEPTDPDYGNGYGMTYLDIVREEFKK